MKKKKLFQPFLRLLSATYHATASAAAVAAAAAAALIH